MKRVVLYLEEIAAQFQTGLATEHSYRSALKSLLEILLPSVTVVNEPAHIACGAPDFLLRSNGATKAPLGYIETKDIGDPDLDGNKANKEQFDRYKSHLFNVAFTDYLDFRFYEDGEFKAAARIAEIRDGKIVPAQAEALEGFIALVEHFGAACPKAISSPARLAKLMAGKARLLARAIRETIAADTGGFGTMRQQMQTIRAFLIHDLSEDAFADIYAQTITYGMFAARLHDPEPKTFSREEAARLIPKTNPLMRKIFLDIAQDLDESLIWIVDDLVALFAAADVATIMQGYGKERGEADPVLHFYEDFLTEYNPKLRRQRGVWYTPTPVVRFIVRAVDRILEQDFALPGGLADKSQIKVQIAGKKDQPVVEREMHRVQILDPATGTGAFLAETVRRIHEKFAAMQGLWPDYARQHLLPRLNGFEILMASYALAHLKLDILLTESGCSLDVKQRLRVFLTNSLENPPIPDTRYMWAAALEQEIREAKAIKNDCPVMVVLGNPPYSGESQNKGKAIMHLMEDYKREPGGREKLKERNPKWINDDYVKFIRLAQHYIDRTGEGVIGFINPHGFLDNPTFRGMRWNLLESFDEIYILNLHGNAKKKETAPDGSKDENVFDIMQGVCINLFVRRKNEDAARSCSVRYADLYGKRADKYAFLESHGLEDIEWQEVTPVAPMYFFTPKDATGEEEYRTGFSLVELFEQNSMGVTTGNDGVLVQMNKEDLLVGVPAAYHEKVDETLVRKFSYRPFDTQYIYYKPTLLARARDKFMNKLQDDTVSLNTIRICSRDDDCPVFVAEGIVDKTILSSKDNANVFPLYLYREQMGQMQKTPNLNPEITARIAEAVGGEATPEDIFHYIYAVLHTPEYREKYKAFLKVDFPRIPFPKDGANFRRFADLGRQLVETHLLRDAKTQDMFNPLARFPATGTNRVDALRFDAGKVSINATQYFDNVPETAWNFFIGGYQPAQKWLKDRKGRALSADDILHYKAIIIALAETARLMAELSALVSKTEALWEN